MTTTTTATPKITKSHALIQELKYSVRNHTNAFALIFLLSIVFAMMKVPVQLELFGAFTAYSSFIISLICSFVGIIFGLSAWDQIGERLENKIARFFAQVFGYVIVSSFVGFLVAIPFVLLMSAF